MPASTPNEGRCTSKGPIHFLYLFTHRGVLRAVVLHFSLYLPACLTNQSIDRSIECRRRRLVRPLDASSECVFRACRRRLSRLVCDMAAAAAGSIDPKIPVEGSATPVDVRVYVCVCVSMFSCPIDSINSKAGRQAQSRSAMMMRRMTPSRCNGKQASSLDVCVCAFNQFNPSMDPSIIDRHTYTNIHRPTQRWWPAEISLPLHSVKGCFFRVSTGRQDTAACAFRVCLVDSRPLDRSNRFDRPPSPSMPVPRPPPPPTRATATTFRVGHRSSGVTTALLLLLLPLSLLATRGMAFLSPPPPLALPTSYTTMQRQPQQPPQPHTGAGVGAALGAGRPLSAAAAAGAAGAGGEEAAVVAAYEDALALYDRMRRDTDPYIDTKVSVEGG